jgi:hypothetical protein
LFQACLSPQNLFKLLVMRRLIEEKKGENREEGILYIVHATYSTIYPPPPKEEHMVHDKTEWRIHTIFLQL